MSSWNVKTITREDGENTSPNLFKDDSKLKGDWSIHRKYLSPDWY